MLKPIEERVKIKFNQIANYVHQMDNNYPNISDKDCMEFAERLMQLAEDLKERLEEKKNS